MSRDAADPIGGITFSSVYRALNSLDCLGWSHDVSLPGGAHNLFITGVSLMTVKTFILESDWIYLVALLLCCSTMVVIDYFLGDNAEYLNAWSVVVKLFRLPVEAPASRLMQQYGVGGELLAVLLVNGAIGFVLVQLARWGLSFGR